MVTLLADMLRWAAAVFAGVAPRRLWPALDRHLPMRAAAAVSGLATMLGGFFYGFGGFMTFATTLADANNNWMLARLNGPIAPGDEAVGLVPYGDGGSRPPRHPLRAAAASDRAKPEA